MDLAAINGYKYVHLSLIMFFFALFNGYAFILYVAFLYFAICAAFSESRFLGGIKGYASSSARDMGVAQHNTKLHTQIVIIASVMQIVLCYFLLPSFHATAVNVPGAPGAGPAFYRDGAGNYAKDGTYQIPGHAVSGGSMAVGGKVTISNR